MGSVWQSVRAAVRSLIRAPGFTFTVVLVLALAVGANTAIFSMVRTVLLRPLPYPSPDRLVWFYETNPERGWERAEVAPANFLDWRERIESFADITALQDWPESLTLHVDGQVERVSAIRVFGNFFSLLGVEATVGRGFTLEESWVGADEVVVLSHDYWRRRFGGDAGVIGRRLRLDGRSRTVVGVMPEGFETPEVVWTSPTSLADAVDLWIPFGWSPTARDSVPFRRAHVVQAIGRLDPGATVEGAERELQAVARRLAGEYPGTNRGMGAGIEPLRESIVQHARLPLLLVMAGIGLVLVIACANIANLVMVRDLGRARRTAIHGALGAGPWRLFLLTLTESLILATLGGAAGLLVALWGTSALVGLAPETIPRTGEVGIDGSILLFTLAITMLTGLLFGLIPAIRSASIDPSRPLRVDDRAGTGSRSVSRISRSVVAFEVALAVVLVAGSGLLLRTIAELQSVDIGFDPEKLAAVEITLPAATYPDFASVSAFHRRLLREGRGLPGVEKAALTSHLPLEGGWRSDFTVAEWDADRFGLNVLHREVSPGYFGTVGTPLLAGRGFEAADVEGAPLVVVVNRTFARRYFPGGDPLGSRIAFESEPDESSTWYTIVGVAGDQRQEGLRGEPGPEIYGSVLQVTGRRTHLIVRSTGEPGATIPLLRRLIGRLDDELPVSRAVLLEQTVAESLERETFLLQLIGAFAIVALILSLLGVYGTTAHAEGRRLRESGIRAALGADSARLLKDALQRGVGPVLVGAAIGLAVALLSAPALRSVLYGVTPADPLTLAAATGLVGLAGLVACWVPARRAARVDPGTAIRSEA